MNILVMGGAGFVGSNLAFYFKEKGHEIFVFDNLVRRGSEFNIPLFKKAGIKFIHGDVRNKEDFAAIPKNIDFIFECSAQPAATVGYQNPYFDFSNNTIGVMNVLEYAKSENCGVILWSTNKVYSADKINQFEMKELETRWKWTSNDNIIVHPNGWNPFHGFANDFTVDGGNHSIYGLSKIMSDLACQEYYAAFGVNTVVFRWSCLAGSGQFGKCIQGWVAWWAIAAYFNLPVQYIGWKGKQVRDVLFAPDICRLIELTVENIDKVAGKVYNVGGGENNTLSLIEATNLMQEKFGKKLETFMTEKSRNADHCIYISDIRKIKEALNWEPKISISEGYDQIIKWIKDNEKQLKQLYE